MVQITYFYTCIFKIGRKVFGHFLGQGGNQYSFVFIRSDIYLGYDIIYLTGNRFYYYFRIHKSGWSDNLFHYLRRLFMFNRTRSGTDVDCLIYTLLKFIEVKRSVIQSTRQSESVVYKSFLSRLVAGVHSSYLR